MFRQLTKSAFAARRFNSTSTVTATKSLSNALIGDLNTRWDHLPAQDQENIVTKLSERQKLDWKQLTPSEKKAAWYVSYGEWGPRKPVHAKGDASKIFNGVIVGVAIALTMFLGIRSVSGGYPTTFNREWQEKSDEYLKSKKANPWSTYSQIQSK